MKNITQVFKIRNVKTGEYSEGTWFSEKALERAATKSYKWAYIDWTDYEIVVMDVKVSKTYPLNKFKSKIKRYNLLDDKRIRDILTEPW